MSCVLPAEDLIPVRLATLAELRRAETRQPGGTILLVFSQEEVAAILAASRQPLNGVLKRLAASGLIEAEFRELVIPDPVRLLDAVAGRSAPRAGRHAGQEGRGSPSCGV